MAAQMRSVLAWIGAGVIVAVLVACEEGQPTVTDMSTPTLGGTQPPAGAATLRADTLATAQSLMTQTPSVEGANGEPSPTPDYGTAAGLPPAAFTGPCPVPEGYRLYSRQGFCIAAPGDWIAYNVDGSGTAPLNTTPGQAISFQPSWAASADECHLTIFIADEESADAHVEHYHAAFAGRTDIASLTATRMQSLAGMALPGFTWTGSDGATGGVFAGVLGERRVVHISFGGSACSQGDLEAAIGTLRFE
jgi:hypothetical protein